MGSRNDEAVVLALNHKVNSLKRSISELQSTTTHLQSIMNTKYELIYKNLRRISVSQAHFRFLCAKRRRKSNANTSNASGTAIPVDGRMEMEVNNTQNNAVTGNNVDEVAIADAQEAVNDLFGIEEMEESTTQPATLSPLPRTLNDLWVEYMFGIGGRKPARLFTRIERGHVKDKYSFRKLGWDVISNLVNSGMTAEDAIQKVYDVYGHSTPTTTILKKIRADKGNGGHPNLFVAALVN